MAPNVSIELFYTSSLVSNPHHNLSFTLLNQPITRDLSNPRYNRPNTLAILHNSFSVGTIPRHKTSCWIPLN